MFKRFLGFLAAGLLLFGFGYLFWLNPAEVEFRLTSARSYRLPLPLLLLLSFLVGASLIFLVALARETQRTLADLRRRRLERQAARQRSTVAAGRSLHREGHSEEARSLLRRALQSPEGFEASLLLAEAALESDRPNEARAVLEQAQARYGDHAQIHALRAAVHRRAGDLGRASEALEKAVELEPRSPRLLGALRDAYVDQRRWTEALRTEESLLVVLRNPEQVLAEQTRVRGLRFEAALSANGDAGVTEELRSLVADDPTFLPAGIALGDRLRSLGRTREAARVWRRLVARRPSPIALARLESLYVELGRPEKAIALYRSLRGFDESAPLVLSFVRFLLAQGRVDEAAAELASVGHRLDHLPDFHAAAAEVHRARGEPEKALEELRLAQASVLAHWACRQCGRAETEWRGRCEGCGAWDTFESREETGAETSEAGPGR